MSSTWSFPASIQSNIYIGKDFHYSYYFVYNWIHSGDNYFIFILFYSDKILGIFLFQGFYISTVFPLVSLLHFDQNRLRYQSVIRSRKATWTISFPCCLSPIIISFPYEFSPMEIWILENLLSNLSQMTTWCICWHIWQIEAHKKFSTWQHRAARLIWNLGQFHV